MKSKHRLAALACAGVLFLHIAPSARAAAYSDLPASHWAYEDMTRASGLGILNGMGDGTMAPEGELTCGQFLVMLARTFAPEDYAARLAGGARWDAAGLAVAEALGLLPDGDLLAVDEESLSRPITRKDVAVLLDRALPQKAEAIHDDDDWSWLWEDEEDEAARLAALPDLYTLAQDYWAPVNRLYDLNIVRGKADGMFGGDEVLRRADGATLLMRTLKSYDQLHYGEKRTVTLRIVDQQGNELAPAQTAEAAVGRLGRYFLEDGSTDALADYTQASDSNSDVISTVGEVFDVVYRPLTDVERAQRDFYAAVERGELSYDDYWWQEFNRYAMDENDYKRQLLFGDRNRSTYDTQEEAEAAMTTVTVPVWKLNSKGQKVSGNLSLTVNQALAGDVLAIFTEIYNDPEQFPIHGAGGYAWRSSQTSEHRTGTAIDINATENYQVRDGKAMVGTHWTPGEDPYSIPEDGSVVRIFHKYGWTWGGADWSGYSDPTTGYHDYMHFSYLGG